jgi:para-aminobenzoate synthetase component I
MIVDLERNDLGKVSKTGTVKVPELFYPEEYATVHHLVATVTGEMQDGLEPIDVIQAAFPGGSITGAPKIRAMEIIDELEPTQRNIYTGSIGYLGFNGSIDFNIAIRTIVMKEGTAYFQAGGGIVWDSDPELEYEETLHKAKALFRTLRNEK